MVCEGQLTTDECLVALKSMSHNKTPGSDGLPVEFYSKLWPDVKDYLVEALNEAYSQGELSNSQKQGVISIIPKKDKNTRLLKNWRPISLLQVDLKIATKSIATRIKNCAAIYY